MCHIEQIRAVIETIGPVDDDGSVSVASERLYAAEARYKDFVGPIDVAELIGVDEEHDVIYATVIHVNVLAITDTTQACEVGGNDIAGVHPRYHVVVSEEVSGRSVCDVFDNVSASDRTVSPEDVCVVWIVSVDASHAHFCCCEVESDVVSVVDR